MSFAQALIRGFKRLGGIPSHGVIFENLKAANELGQPAERREALAVIENELNKYAEKPSATGKDMQIITNLKVLLAYYKARNIENIVDKKQEFYRIKHELQKDVKDSVNGKKYTSGTIKESRDAVISVSNRLERELESEKSSYASANSLIKSAVQVAAEDGAGFPIAPTGTINFSRGAKSGEDGAGFPIDPTGIINFSRGAKSGEAKKSRASTTATNRFLSAVAQQVAAEQGARFAKAPTGTTKLSKAGHGGHRQTRRKHRKGKKSTRRR